MACPKCGCKLHYQFDSGWDGEPQDEGMERCAACRHVFPSEDAADDEDDAYGVKCPDAPSCPCFDKQGAQVSPCWRQVTNGAKEMPTVNAAFSVVNGIAKGRQAFRDGKPRESLSSTSERIGWDEAEYDAGNPGVDPCARCHDTGAVKRADGVGERDAG